jgi:hypothetical protein
MPRARRSPPRRSNGCSPQTARHADAELEYDAGAGDDGDDRGIPEASAHFSRFPVTEIALSAGALAQFDDAPILRAAELLAHAKVDVIAWNGTSSGWLRLRCRSSAVRADHGGDEASSPRPRCWR